MTRVFVDIGGVTTRDAAGGTGMRPIGMRPTPRNGTITTETARTGAGLPCLLITMRGDGTPDLFPTLLKEADDRGVLGWSSVLVFDTTDWRPVVTIDGIRASADILTHHGTRPRRIFVVTDDPFFPMVFRLIERVLDDHIAPLEMRLFTRRAEAMYALERLPLDSGQHGNDQSPDGTSVLRGQSFPPA